MARSGGKARDTMCAGFSAYCLETLEEVAQRYAEQFQSAGGSALRYISALNADGTHLDFLAALARRQFAGPTAPDQDVPQAAGPERPHERRLGPECVSPCSCRWAQRNDTKTSKQAGISSVHD